MKKTLTLSCLLASCIVLTGCSFFWKDKKVEEENNVNVEFVDPCAAASWVFTLWELWSICKFDDWSFCSTTSFLEWECKKWDKYEEVKYSENKWLLYCSEDYDPVCWEDGYMYMNECLLERQEIKKSENLKAVNWVCVEVEETEE